MLALKRKDLLAQKESVLQLQSKPLRISKKDVSVEELKMLLQLSQDELETTKHELSQERRQNGLLEQRLQCQEEAYRTLESTNASLTTLLS